MWWISLGSDRGDCLAVLGTAHRHRWSARNPSQVWLLLRCAGLSHPLGLSITLRTWRSTAMDSKEMARWSWGDEGATSDIAQLAPHDPCVYPNACDATWGGVTSLPQQRWWGCLDRVVERNWPLFQALWQSACDCDGRFEQPSWIHCQQLHWQSACRWREHPRSTFPRMVAEKPALVASNSPLLPWRRGSHVDTSGWGRS